MALKFMKHLGLATVLVCCSTTRLSRLPDQTERDKLKALPPAEITAKAETYESTKDKSYQAYMARYLNAMQLRTKEPQKACDEFLQLSTEEFWGRTMAQIRAAEFCSLTAIVFQPGDLEALMQKPYYRFEYMRSQHRRAIQEGNKEQELKTGFELARAGGRKKDRITLLQRGIELSKSLNRNAELKAHEDLLVRVAPRFRKSPEKKQMMEVADDLRNSRQFDSARKLYRQIFRDKARTEAERMRALDGIAKSYKLQLNRQQHLKALEEIVDFHLGQFKKRPRDKRLANRLEDAKVDLARAQWTEDMRSTAIATLVKTEELLKGVVPLDRIYWLRARIDEEVDQNESALQWVERALKDGPSNVTLGETLRWQRAWLQRRLGRLSEAEKGLADLELKALSPFTKAKYSYWLGRVLQEQNKSDEASRVFEQLAQDDPFGFYGLMAYRHLNRPFALSSFTENSKDSFIEPAPGFDDYLFTWLMDVNEVPVARRYLEDYLNNNPGLSKAKVTFMARVGLYNRLYGELSAMAPDKRNNFIRQNIEYFFPRDHREVYERSAELAGADLGLLYSITRQESGFDPFARSHADAFGLMQLLPEVAESVAKKTSVPYSDPEDLFQPEVNVPLGAHFIQMLLRRFDGAFIPGVGSYNASENAIKGWIRTRYKGDPISFIEEIPYEETKSYVKLVMRNYIFYQMLMAPDGRIDFPSYVLQVVPESSATVQASTAPATETGSNSGPNLKRFTGL